MHNIRSRIIGVNIPSSERVVTGLLGAAALVYGAHRRTLGGVAIATIGGIALVRALTGRCPMTRARAIKKGVHVRRVVTIQAPASQIYEKFRELHLRDVDILEHTQGRRIRWRDGDDVGELDLREGDRGTVVEWKMHYKPSGGIVVASLFYGFLRKLARVDIGLDLVRLRQLIETGEIATGERMPTAETNAVYIGGAA
jgi:uncharacterized membrane protein